jgi:hypothetical protein
MNVQLVDHVGTSLKELGINLPLAFLLHSFILVAFTPIIISPLCWFNIGSLASQGCLNNSATPRTNYNSQ